MAIWHRNYSTFAFEILWRASMTALAMADDPDKQTRKDHLSIHALLAAFLAFEGYVNFVGEEIAAETWAKEREFFSRGQYRGIIGKVDYLFTLFPGAQLDKERDPYHTFHRIKRIRDSIAHNKVLRYAMTSESEVMDFKTSWDDFDSPEKVRPAVAQLKELAEMIRLEALKILIEEYKLSHLHFKAFEGPLAEANGTTRG